MLVNKFKLAVISAILLISSGLTLLILSFLISEINSENVYLNMIKSTTCQISNCWDVGYNVITIELEYLYHFKNQTLISSIGCTQFLNMNHRVKCYYLKGDLSSLTIEKLSYDPVRLQVLMSSLILLMVWDLYWFILVLVTKFKSVDQEKTSLINNLDNVVNL